MRIEPQRSQKATPSSANAECVLVRRALVIEDCPRFGPLLQAELREVALEVALAASAAEARRLLPLLDPELVLLDVCLPDANGLDLWGDLQALPRVPAVVVVSSTHDPVVGFRLAEAGARAFVTKPVARQRLLEAVTQAIQTAPDVTPQLRASVGHVPVRDLEARVRGVMLREALARSRGSRRGAARLLNVSRQLLQHMLRTLDERV